MLSAVATDARLEWGLVGLAVVELLLSVATAALALLSVCESCGVVDQTTIHHINKLTVLNPAFSPSIQAIWSEASITRQLGLEIPNLPR